MRRMVTAIRPRARTFTAVGSDFDKLLNNNSNNPHPA